MKRNKEPQLFFVEIDPKSIERNPNAGETEAHILINSTCEFTVRGKHRSLENDKVRMTGSSSKMSSEEIYYETHYLLIDYPEKVDILIEKLMKRFKNRLKYTVTNNYDHLNFMEPEPPYFFKHKKTKVKCCHCGKKFLHPDLKDESDYDYEGNCIGRSNICPKCNTEDCCDLSFENMEDLLLKKANLPKMIIR